MKRGFIFLLALLSLPVKSQTPDSTKIFTLQQFYDQILTFHPVASQAKLLPEQAKRLLQEARGSFDPKIELDFSRKRFDNELYYNFLDTYVKVPVLPLGMELKAGYEQNTGSALGTDIRTPPDGLTYAGISLPVGQGLFVDMRRNVLRQAEIYQNIAEAERVGMINKLIFAAAKDYWNWYFAYRQFRWVNEGYNLADARFEAVKRRALAEDAAPIDTVEALITLQDRLVQRQQAEVTLQNARLSLSAYLWGDDRRPRELANFVIPDTNRIAEQQVAAGKFQDLLLQAENNHPDLLKLTFKNRQLGWDERLAREMLKPRINLNYNYLTYYSSPKNPFGADNWSAFEQNYKFGVDFSFPVLLRKERGKLQQTRIKILQNEYELLQSRRDVGIELRSVYNQLQNLNRQLVTLKSTVQNQERLVRAEYQKFEIGESSLFLINTRENKLIDFRVKLEEVKSKYEKSLAELIFAAGLSGNLP
jgi:outer membrane protein TolC